jgi:3-deoxy-D-manno-octulosonic-acid transferase
MLETEIWPTLYLALHKRGIPIVLASARLSERSVRRYGRFGALGSRLLSSGVTVCAQSAVDAQRFIAVGATPDNVRVTGNVKFDLQIPCGDRGSGTPAPRRMGRRRETRLDRGQHARRRGGRRARRTRRRAAS